MRELSAAEIDEKQKYHDLNLKIVNLSRELASLDEDNSEKNTRLRGLRNSMKS